MFNTPGANANAVKELVAAAMLLASRDIVGGVAFARDQDRTLAPADFSALMEREKKRFAGAELAGKTLGVSRVLAQLVAWWRDSAWILAWTWSASIPALSVEAAWRLPSEVRRMKDVQTLLGCSDFISLHLPVLDTTRGLINRRHANALSTR